MRILDSRPQARTQRGLDLPCVSPFLCSCVTMPPEWPEYLEAVDETPAAVEIREAAEVYMVKHNLKDPRQAAGLAEKDLKAMEGWESLSPPVRALLVRTMWHVNKTVRASTRPNGGPQWQAGPAEVAKVHMPNCEPMREHLMALMGHPHRKVDEAQVQEACCAVKVHLNIKELLVNADMPEVPYDMVEEEHVYRVIKHFTDKAAKGSGPQFIYVDISREPAYGMGTMTGASAGYGGHSLDVSGIPLWTLSASQYRGCCASNRVIRSLPQWLMAYVRMLVAMTTCGMQDMQFWITHMYTVLKIAQQDEATGGLEEETKGYLAVMYDDCRRQEWADQAEQHPHKMDMQAEASQVNEHTMVKARATLASVMQSMKVQKEDEMQRMSLMRLYAQQWGVQGNWYQPQPQQKQQLQKKVPKSKLKAQDFFEKCRKWKAEKHKEAKMQAQHWAFSPN